MAEPVDKTVDAADASAAEKQPETAPPQKVSEEAPVEVHPPHAPAHSFKEFFIQLVTITAGILIALSLEGLLEWNHHRLLVREARATLAREIANNQSALERHLAGADARVKEVDSSLTLTKDLLTTKKSDVHQFQLSFQLPSLNAAGWQSAERTGALAFMEYSEVQHFAELYDLQDLYAGQLRRLIERTVSAVSIATAEDDPHRLAPGDLERLRQALLDLRGDLLADEQLGEQLSKAYKEQLQR